MAVEPDFSIHVVVVSHDPGLWFDETLESIAAQDHRLAAVTVVDAASESDPTARVQRFLPEAEVRRLDANPGFGPAANRVLIDAGCVPDFFVFCHDDVVLAPDALRVLAREAVQSNAGIVSPKYVDWADPDRLLRVGLMVDKIGTVISTVESGELDQSQHDVVQDVFAVPGGCVLVRGDLFAAIGGFDPEMSFCYEHVDLCWRARTAGARVVVAPAAVVRHRRRLSERLDGALVDGLTRRHRIRTLLSVYGGWHLARVIPQAAMHSAAELLAALATGQLGRARRIGAAWGHNLVRLGSIRRRRRAVRQARRVGDSRIRLSQARGFALILARMGGWRSGRAEQSLPGSSLVAGLGRSRALLTVGLATVILVLLGARDLIAGGIPAAGDLVRLGSSSDLLSGWWSGFRPVGLGQEGFAPTGLGVLTLLSWLFAGQTGLLRTALIVGMVPLGALGVWRLMGPFDSRWIQGVALAVYLANPLPYNALANGVWGALLLYGAVPWLMRAVLAGSGLAPYGSVDGSPGPGARRPSFWREALAVGLLFGLAVALAAGALIVLGLVLAGLIAGSLIAGSARGMIRMAAAAAVGAAVAGVLNLPWLVDGLPSLLGDRSGGTGGDSWAEILRFDSGPFGDSRLGWALPAAAVLPLALAHDSRLAWAVRGWTLYLGTAAAALAAERGWSPVPVPRPEAIQIPGAVGLAMAVSMGVAAFLVDIRRHRFGWRQIVPFTAVAALVAGMLPALAVASDGDWNATRGDYRDVAPFSEGGVDHRVLWLGHPDVLPLAGWKLDDSLSFSVSSSREFPSAAQRWAGPLDDRTGRVADAILGAPESGADRLGAELSQWGIGTILVAERLAPAPYGELSQPAPQWLVDMLDSQLDLVPGGLTAGIASYRNTAIDPEGLGAALQFPPDDGTSALVRLLLALQVALWVAAVAGFARLCVGEGRSRVETAR
ncbi:MAG: glycosyltransferase [bacterium]|nr:glycosyltransferase [bacterium]